jgi:hypothetical protein
MSEVQQPRSRSSVARWARITAGLVLLVGAGGAGFVLGQDDGEPRVASSETRTVERTTTTRPRPTVTGRPATTAPPETTTTTAPPVTVYEAPPTVTAPPETWCDAACTAALICGWDGCTDTTEQAPCTPSTFTSCDPDEPMDLPAFGCDYLERTWTGDVRCAG